MRPLLLCLVLALTESEHVGTALEGDAVERLGQSVGCLVLRGNMLHLDGIGFDVVANEEVLQPVVLSACHVVWCLYVCLVTVFHVCLVNLALVV